MLDCEQNAAGSVTPMADVGASTARQARICPPLRATGAGPVDARLIRDVRRITSSGRPSAPAIPSRTLRRCRAKLADRLGDDGERRPDERGPRAAGKCRECGLERCLTPIELARRRRYSMSCTSSFVTCLRISAQREP